MRNQALEVFEPRIANRLESLNRYAKWFDRSRLVQELYRHGLPRYRSERWKYQNPSRLVDSVLSESSDYTVINSDNLEGTSFDTVSRFCQESLSRDLATTFSHSSLTTLNGILFSKGTSFRVPEANKSILQLEGFTASVECFYIELERDSELEIEDSSIGGNHVIFCRLGTNSRLNLVRLNDQSDEAECRFVRVEAGDSSKFSYHLYGLGSPMRSNEVVVDLNGPQASAELTGVLRISGADQVNHFFTVNHNSADCRTEQSVRTVLKDQASCVFNGRIHIRPGARKTEAHLVNNNLTVGGQAEAFAKPELAIFNDDVICSHGVTTGRLDQESLFYLQSRGIPEDRAQEILVRGFLREFVRHESGTRLLGL